MKRTLGILALALALAACSDKVGEWRPAPELQNARDLMPEHPDSALRVLICFDVEDKTSTDLEDKANLAATGCEGLQHEYQILVAEALYKNYYQQVGGNACIAATGVVSATAYYDSIFGIYPKNKDLAFETARAHYYKAVGETENDDIVAACEDYIKAAGIMETAFHEIVKAAEKGNVMDENYAETRFISLIYNRIGNLMCAEYYYEQSVNNYKTALNYAECTGDRMFVANLLKHIGDSYYLGNLPDSALVYYNKALDARSDNEILKCNINVAMASIYYEKGFADTAYNLLKMNKLSSDKFVIAQTNYTMGRLLFKEVKYDSALYYLEPCFEDGSKPMRLASAKMLAEIYDSIGDKERAAFCNKFISENAISEINRSVKVRELANYYNNYQANRDEEKHRKEVLLYVIFATLLVSIAIAFLYLGKKKNKKLSEVVKKQGNAVRNLKSENAKLEKKNASVTTLNGSYSGTNIDQCLKNYVNCNIGIALRKRVLPRNISKKNISENYDIALTDSEKILVRSQANKCIPSFTNVLTDKFGIKGDNVLLCCLAMLGFSISETAALMKVTYQSASRRVISIKEKLGTDGDIASFITTYLQNLYNQQKA